VLATLWRTIASQLASLGGGACCDVCLSSNGSYQATPSLVGLCRRAQAPTLKEVHKEQVGLATHASTTAIQQEIKARVIFFSLFFFIFSFIFVFLFFAFFCLFPEANHNFLFVLADFALVENEQGIGGRHLWRQRPRQPAVRKKQDWSGRWDLAAPFQFFASVKMIIIIVIIIIIQQILNKSNHPSRWGGALGRVTTPMRELSMLVSF
jgi:hypothetical protein